MIINCDFVEGLTETIGLAIMVEVVLMVPNYGNSTLALQTGNLEVVMRNGKLGVNTSSPSNGILHVAGGDVYTSSGGNYFDAGFGNGQGTADYTTYNSNTSIYAEHNILTSGQFLAESDKRVKTSPSYRTTPKI